MEINLKSKKEGINMVAKIQNKGAIVICDCIGCNNKPSWRQGFWTNKGLVIVDLCEKHHFILRTKVPRNISLDENVLKWLLIQEANSNRVTMYGVISGSSDLEVMRALEKIEIDLE